MQYINFTDIKINTIESRQEDGGNGRLEGTAAPFERYATIGTGRNRKSEKIRRGAFKRRIAELNAPASETLLTVDARQPNDIKALVDHNPQQLLGRLSRQVKTLRLREADVGLLFQLDLPATTLGADIRALAVAGLLAGVSIGFLSSGSTSKIIENKPDFLLQDSIPVGGLAAAELEDSSVLMDGSDSVRGMSANNDGSRFEIFFGIDLREISILTGSNPAYPHTSVVARSDEQKKLKNWITINENPELI